MTHRDCCKLVACYWLNTVSHDLVSWEIKLGRAVFDVLAITSNPRKTYKRVTATEVKCTRSDMLKDLRSKKLLKYERRATHCYLAATLSAYTTQTIKSQKQILEDLESKGLPAHWGILLIQPNVTEPVKTLRTAKRIKTVQLRTIQGLTRKIARSFAYRALNPDSPL